MHGLGTEKLNRGRKGAQSTWGENGRGINYRWNANDGKAFARIRIRLSVQVQQRMAAALNLDKERRGQLGGWTPKNEYAEGPRVRVYFCGRRPSVSALRSKWRG